MVMQQDAEQRAVQLGQDGGVQGPQRCVLQGGQIQGVLRPQVPKSGEELQDSQSILEDGLGCCPRQHWLQAEEVQDWLQEQAQSEAARLCVAYSGT